VAHYQAPAKASNSSREAQEVMNLPDNLGTKKNKDSSPGGGYSLNNDIISDMNKKNQLNRINIKFGAA